MIKAGSAVITVLFLLLGTALPAVSDTVYILPGLMDTGGTASAADLVTTAGNGNKLFELPKGMENIDYTEISFLSRSYIENNLKLYALRPVVFVGEGTIYIPKRYAESGQSGGIRSLAEAVLDKHNRIGEPYDRTEIVFDEGLEELERMLEAAEGKGSSSPVIEFDPRNNGEATLRFSPGNGREGRITVRGYYMTASAHRSLEAGQPVTAADLTVREISASQKGYGVISPAEILRGYVASRGIAEGERITRYNIRKRIDVKAGEGIVVFASRGAVEVKLSATARESGRVGEVISVKPRNGEKVIRARITSPGEAVVEGL